MIIQTNIKVKISSSAFLILFECYIKYLISHTNSHVNKLTHNIQKDISHKSAFQFSHLYFLKKLTILVTIGINVNKIRTANRFGILY